MKLADLTTVPRAQCRPMTDLEVKLFIAIQLDKVKREPVPADKLPEAINALDIFKPEFVETERAQILLKRLTLTDALFDPHMAMFACVLADNPGRCVLWAYTLFRRGVELGRPYTLNDWTADFPEGPPTNDGMLVVWDAQKKPRGEDDERGVLGWPTDNLLDTAEPWKVTEEASC